MTGDGKAKAGRGNERAGGFKNIYIKKNEPKRHAVGVKGGREWAELKDVVV